MIQKIGHMDRIWWLIGSVKMRRVKCQKGSSGSQLK